MELKIRLGLKDTRPATAVLVKAPRRLANGSLGAQPKHIIKCVQACAFYVVIECLS